MKFFWWFLIWCIFSIIVQANVPYRMREFSWVIGAVLTVVLYVVYSFFRWLVHSVEKTDTPPAAPPITLQKQVATLPAMSVPHPSGPPQVSSVGLGSFIGFLALWIFAGLILQDLHLEYRSDRVTFIWVSLLIPVLFAFLAYIRFRRDGQMLAHANFAVQELRNRFKTLESRLQELEKASGKREGPSVESVASPKPKEVSLAAKEAISPTVKADEAAKKILLPMEKVVPSLDVLSSTHIKLEDERAFRPIGDETRELLKDVRQEIAAVDAKTTAAEMSATGEEILSTSSVQDAEKELPAKTQVRPGAKGPSPATFAQKTAASVRSRKSASSSVSWETLVGEKLLSYVGIVILVLGLGFLLAYSLTRLGPQGRIAVGITASALLLGLGCLLEKKAAYTWFSHIMMAGGWAVLYFVAYGAYHIEALRVITNPVAGTVLMAMVAVAIIAHTVKYASETLTGIALLLGYITLFITPVSLYTHVAALVLAVLLSIFAWKFRWLTTQLLGVMLLYGGYGVWLYFQPHRSLPQHQAEYTLVTLFVISLWALLKIPDFSKPKDIAREDSIMPIIGILNLLGLAMVRKIGYINFHTSGSPVSSLALGLLFVAMAQVLRTRGRNMIYRVDSTLGVILIMVGLWCLIPQYANCMFAWISLGIFVFLYSLYRQDRYFRDLGNLVIAVATVMVLGGDIPKKMVTWFYQLASGELFFSPNQPSALPDKTLISTFASGLVGALGAIVLYLTAFTSALLLKIRGKWQKAGDAAREQIITVLATLSMMVALFRIMPDVRGVYAWLGLGVVLFQYGILRKEYYIRYLSHLVLLWSVCTGPILGLPTTQIGYTMAIGAILIYIDGFFTARLLSQTKPDPVESAVEKWITLAATTVLMIGAQCVLHDELHITLSWLVLGALLFYYGIFRQEDFIRIMAHTVVTIACCRALIPVLSENDAPVRLIGAWQANRSVVALVFGIFLYYLHSFHIGHMLKGRKDKQWIMWEEGCLMTLGNAVLFLVLWYTLPPIAIAIAYALAGMIFLVCGTSWHRPYLQTHSGLALLLSGFWLFIVNMNATGYWGREGLGWQIDRRLLSSITVLALWIYARGNWDILLREKKPLLIAQEIHIPSLISYMSFAAILTLIYFHAYQDGLGWMLFGAILLGLILVLHHPRYALQALIAIGMGTCSLCAVATRLVGDAWEYTLLHWALLVGPILLFAAHFFCKEMRTRLMSVVEIETVETPVFQNSRKIYAIGFCAVTAFLVTALLPHSFYAVGWGLTGLVLGSYGLSFREKFFRWTALTLFGMSVAKIVLYDIWSFATETKIVILLGVAVSLLFVSFLYHRFKDQWTRFLMED